MLYFPVDDWSVADLSIPGSRSNISRSTTPTEGTGGAYIYVHMAKPKMAQPLIVMVTVAWHCAVKPRFHVRVKLF